MLFQTFDDPFRLVEFRGVVQQRGVRCRIEHQIVTVALGVGVDGVEDLFLVPKRLIKWCSKIGNS